MKRKQDLIVCGIVAVALVWSGATILADQFSALRGSVTCDCETCGDTTEIVYECGHWATPWPPNPITNPCSSTWCIKNRVYYAECPEMSGGASCPYEVQSGVYWLKQEHWTAAPSECSSPEYEPWVVDESSSNCQMLDQIEDMYDCDVETACTGTVSWTEYRWGRKVCDL